MRSSNAGSSDWVIVTHKLAYPPSHPHAHAHLHLPGVPATSTPTPSSSSASSSLPSSSPHSSAPSAPASERLSDVYVGEARAAIENDSLTPAERSSCFLHLTNIPYAASGLDVHQHLKLISGASSYEISRSARGDEAVVELPSTSDKATALACAAQTQPAIRGRVVRVAAISEDEARALIKNEFKRDHRKDRRPDKKRAEGEEKEREKDEEAAKLRAFDDAFLAVCIGAPSAALVALLTSPRLSLTYVPPTAHFFEQLALYAVTALPSVYPSPASSVNELRSAFFRAVDRTAAFTPFHSWAFAPHSLLHALVYLNRVDVLKAVLTKSNVDTADCRQTSLLSYAVGLKCSAQTVQLLLDAGAHVSSAGVQKMTPLHFACSAMSPHLPLLLSTVEPPSTSINPPDVHRVTPLHICAKLGWTEGLQWLKDSGAQSTYDVWGRLPLWYAAEAFKNEYQKRLNREKAIQLRHAKDDAKPKGGSDGDGRHRSGRGGRGGGVPHGRSASSRGRIRSGRHATAAEIALSSSNTTPRSAHSLPDAPPPPGSVCAVGYVTLRVPNNSIGRLMGLRSRTLRSLQDSTGATIRVSASSSSAVDATDTRVVLVQGTEAQIAAARAAITDVVRERNKDWQDDSPISMHASSSTPPTVPATTSSSAPPPTSSPSRALSTSTPSPPQPTAQSLVDNICLLASDQLSAIHLLFEQVPSPVVQHALITLFTPAAIVLYLQRSSGPNSSYYRNDNPVLMALSRFYLTNPQSFFTSPAVMPALFGLLASEVDKRTQTTFASAFDTRMPAAAHLPMCVTELARVLRVAARVTLFCHAPAVDRAQDFVDQFFPVLLSWWTAAGRPNGAAFVRDFAFTWELLDSCLMDVDRDVEASERLGVLIHCFFQWTQTFPDLTFAWRDQDGKLFPRDQDGAKLEAAGEGAIDESEGDELRRRRAMRAFLQQDWSQGRGGRGRGRGGRGRGQRVGAEADAATVHQWSEEAKVVDDVDVAKSDAQALAALEDDSKEEKTDSDDTAMRTAPALQRYPYTSSQPSCISLAPASSSSSSTLARHKRGPALLSLLSRPPSAAFRSFILQRHHGALLHILNDNEGMFHRHFYFLLAMPGGVGLDMRLRFLRSAIEVKSGQGQDGEEVVIAVNRLGIERWDSEGSDDDDNGYDDEEEDEADDDSCECSDDEEADEIVGDLHWSQRNRSSGGRTRSARPAVTASPATAASTTSASTAASAASTSAVAAGAAAASAPQSSADQLELIMQQILSASPHSLTTNLVARFVGERGVGDGPIRELLVMTTSMLFCPTSPWFSLNPNGSAYHIHPSNPAVASLTSQSLMYYELAGRVLALCLVHGVPTGISVSYSLLSLVCGGHVTLTDMKEFDVDIYRSFLHMVRRFSEKEQRDRSRGAAEPASDDDEPPLYFTCDVTVDGRRVEQELVPRGATTVVQASSLSLFLRLYSSQRIFGPLAPAANAFAAGFNAIVPRALLAILSPTELHALLQGQPTGASVAALRSRVSYHDGLQADSALVRWFWEWVDTLPDDGLRRLWSFWGGHEVLGWPAVRGQGAGEGWHIERGEDEPEDWSSGARRAKGKRADVERVLLPSSSTCTYTLRLPRYATKEQLQRGMTLALEYGAKGFGEA